MKKTFFGPAMFGSLALLAAMLFLPATSSATAVKYLEIKIVSVKVWPVKPSGKCWDPCFMKKYAMPARGKKNYSKYFSNQNFRTVCTGSKAPDPFVEVKVGKYEKFTTAQVNNQCNPTFNVKKVFRVPANAPFSVTVFDNDGAAGVRVKRDLMGTKAWTTIPAKLANGGRMVIGPFGQVEQLILESKVVAAPKAGCAGTYSVRVVEVDVKPTKQNGKPWDRGWGKFKLPDLFVTTSVGNTTFRTPPKKGSAKNTLQTTFNHPGTVVAIKKGMTVKVTVWDGDGTLVGNKEKVGETAVGDACTIIKAGGKHTFTNFGQVNKLVLIFTKK